MKKTTATFAAVAALPAALLLTACGSSEVTAPAPTTTASSAYVAPVTGAPDSGTEGANPTAGPAASIEPDVAAITGLDSPDKINAYKNAAQGGGDSVLPSSASSLAFAGYSGVKLPEEHYKGPDINRARFVHLVLENRDDTVALKKSASPKVVEAINAVPFAPFNSGLGVIIVGGGLASDDIKTIASEMKTTIEDDGREIRVSKSYYSEFKKANVSADVTFVVDASGEHPIITAIKEN